jgi:hypothetical protein
MHLTLDLDSVTVGLYSRSRSSGSSASVVSSNSSLVRALKNSSASAYLARRPVLL